LNGERGLGADRGVVEATSGRLVIGVFEERGWGEEAGAPPESGVAVRSSLCHRSPKGGAEGFCEAAAGMLRLRGVTFRPFLV
jgi:hypothetical protein